MLDVMSFVTYKEFYADSSVMAVWCSSSHQRPQDWCAGQVPEAACLLVGGSDLEVAVQPLAFEDLLSEFLSISEESLGARLAPRKSCL